MPEQQQVQPQQQPEGAGMAREFAENPSMEILRERRIDQIVAKKEAERAQIAQAMNNAENQGLQEGARRGFQEGSKVGFMDGHAIGHNTGLENGFRRGYDVAGQESSAGLGKSLGSNSLQQEASETVEPDDGNVIELNK